MKQTYKPKPSGQILLYLLLLAAVIAAMVKLRSYC
jgi:hypothetical protein